MIATTVEEVPVDRLVGDVQSSAAGEAVEFGAGGLPGEGGAGGIVVREVGWQLV